MSAPRAFTPEEDEIIRAIGRREIAVAKACEMLRCSQDALYRRMDELGIPRQRNTRNNSIRRLTAKGMADRLRAIADYQAKGMTISQIAKAFNTGMDALELWMDRTREKLSRTPLDCMCCERKFMSTNRVTNRLCDGCSGQSVSPYALDPGGGTGRRKPTGIGRH